MLKHFKYLYVKHRLDHSELFVSSAHLLCVHLNMYKWFVHIDPKMKGINSNILLPNKFSSSKMGVLVVALFLLGINQALSLSPIECGLYPCEVRYPKIL